MDYVNFESQLLSDLSNNQNCTNLINQNEPLIENNLGVNGHSTESFVKKLNDLILNNINDYKQIQYILQLPVFDNVLNVFRESDILIKATIKGNEELITWLLDMKINACVQDENGMTALMHAVKNDKLDFLVDYFLENERDCINLSDKNGENVLFHALKSNEMLKKLVQNRYVDNNHVNKRGDNVLLHCCKYGIMEPLKILSFISIDYNAVDSQDRTAAMYLVDKGKYEELQLFVGGNVDLDYRNKNNETVLSILMNNMSALSGTENPGLISLYIRILMILVQMECDFNITIDEEGNTPLMYLIMVKDYCSINYIMTFNRRLNVSIPNKNGITAFLYSLKDGNTSLIDRIIRHRTFNFEYYDKFHNNLLMNYTCNNNARLVSEIIKLRPHLMNEVNDKKENALILAVKFDNSNLVKMFIEKNNNNINNKNVKANKNININSNPLKNNNSGITVNVNQCDELGNNALYYAVENKNVGIVNQLTLAECDMHHKNNQGVSPYDLAMTLGNKSIIHALQKPSKRDSRKKDKKDPDKKKNGLFSVRNRKQLKKEKKSTRKTMELCVNSLSHSPNEDIIKFEIPEFKNKYEPIEPQKEITECIVNTYSTSHNKDYSQLSRGLKAAGTLSVGEVLVDGVLEIVDIVADVIGDIVF